MDTAPAPATVRPKGRDQIRAALIDSTLHLLEVKGLDVSIREIAARADVPHSLIGRYFGSRDGLVQTAIASTLRADQDLASTVTSSRAGVDALFEAGLLRPDRLRILVQLLQAGMAPEEIRAEAPLLAKLRALVEADAPPHADPRIIAATVWAAIAGWVLTEEFAVHHAGLDDEDRDEVRAQMAALLHRLVEPAGSGST